MKMPKFVKKPIPVDAWQIKFDTVMPDWVADAILEYRIRMNKEEKNMKIVTLEGTMTAYEGDYVIKGPMGDYWFNKQNIFEANYDELAA